MTNHRNPETEYMPKIYLSGKMLGEDDLGHKMFAKYAEKYRSLGFTVVSPPELDLPNETRKEALRRDADLILSGDIDRLYMLPNWKESPGATMERVIAETVFMPVYDAETGEQMDTFLNPIETHRSAMTLKHARALAERVDA